jgi:hypothetical protein
MSSGNRIGGCMIAHPTIFESKPLSWEEEEEQQQHVQNPNHSC